MENLKECIKTSINDLTFVQMVISNKRDKDGDINKIDSKPVIIKNEIMYQISYYTNDKVYHENLKKEEFIEKISDIIYENYKQCMIFTLEKDIQILLSKKRKVKIIDHKPTKKDLDLSHNREKNYILKDNEKIDFLIKLDIMDKNGKVKPSKFDKFKQINRFLELVEDVIDDIKDKEVINIVDFGCGKSYLTFALYYYLVQILDLNVNIIGLDLKEDVIKFCSKTAKELNYENLEFQYGDIKDYKSDEKINMIVTLHACDIATDAALVQAISWDCDVILSVPCCQSEFFSKIENETLNPMLKHGIIKEKLSSLVTDSLRGKVLELFKYDVELLEFIDMEHTPKNILIRAKKNDKKVVTKEDKDSYHEFKKFWSLDNIFIEEELNRHNINL